jgi:hypothetical protein
MKRTFIYKCSLEMTENIFNQGLIFLLCLAIYAYVINISNDIKNQSYLLRLYSICFEMILVD